MRTFKGLSLVEVLVSLLLVTSASLSLIQQQWHISQYSNQMHRRNDALSQLDNASELWNAQRALKPSSSTVLGVSWQDSSSSGNLKRTMVVS